MQQNQTLFPNLGVGLGYRNEFRDQFREGPPHPVSWIEVISENFMTWEDGTQPPAIRNLKRLRSEMPVVLHGVSLSLGSAAPLNQSYLKRWKKLIQEIEPTWVSDHLCWTGASGQNLHDLLPLPYTQETINLMVEKIDRVQSFLKRRILIENLSSYVEFNQSDMTEWEFLKQILTRTDCGLLLDVNNVYVSSVNHQFDPIEYLNALPKRNVGQIHLAGHSDDDGFLVDTHDEPICEAVWNLYEWSRKHFGSITTMIERDSNFPQWEEMEAELLRLNGIQPEGLTHEQSSTPPFEISASL